MVVAAPVVDGRHVRDHLLRYRDGHLPNHLNVLLLSALLLDDLRHVHDLFLDDGRPLHDLLLRHGDGLLHTHLDMLLLDVVLLDNGRRVHDLPLRHGDGHLCEASRVQGAVHRLRAKLVLDRAQRGGGVESPVAPGGAITCVRSCLLYTSPSPRDVEESRMPSSA